MQESALRQEEAWETANLAASEEPVLPGIQTLALRAAQQWIDRGRPNVHEMYYVKQSRKVLGFISFGGGARLTHGGCVGPMKFGSCCIYFLVADSGQLFFSFNPPENRKFYAGYPIENFMDCFVPSLQAAFIKNAFDLMSAVIQQKKPISR